MLALLLGACTGTIVGEEGSPPLEDAGDASGGGGDVLGDLGADDTSSSGDGDPVEDATPEDTGVEDVLVEDVRADVVEDAPSDVAPVDVAQDVAQDVVDERVQDVLEDLGPDVVEDVVDEPDAPVDQGMETLLDRSGCFFEVTQIDDVDTHNFGDVGTRYRLLVVDFDVVAAGWRADAFGRDILNHNIFGLFRNGNQSYMRYILGVGAQIDPQVANLRRRLLFFARNAIEPGFASYYSVRRDFAWQIGQTYHIHVELDSVASEQRLTLSRGGQVEAQMTEALPWFNPSFTNSGWYLEFGAPESDGRDVSPVGWQYCDAQVRGEVVP